MSQRMCMQIATDTMFIQMSANKGFKKYEQPSITAVIKEFTQLSNGAVLGKPMVKLVNISTLTPLEKHKALLAVNLIKEKFCGELKGRTCADGSRQHKYLKEDELVVLPTALLESLIMSLLINTYEDRDNSILTF